MNRHPVRECCTHAVGTAISAALAVAALIRSCIRTDARARGSDGGPCHRARGDSRYRHRAQRSCEQARCKLCYHHRGVQQIREIAPLSTADLFKVTPGVWAESSGGESGANVFVRGFAVAGDAQYATVQFAGSPIYPPSTLSFLENSTLFRLDETIDHLEALRGGPNPVFRTARLASPSTSFRRRAPIRPRAW